MMPNTLEGESVLSKQRSGHPVDVQISAWLSQTPIHRLRRSLLDWYATHHRQLPWRESTSNPYYILVSEFMLQQTQVATVIDYFNRFVARFPTVQSLASADEQQVLRFWQGLGYYRRARNLHAAAQKIVACHAGRIPDQLNNLLHLPGVGRYTAGAIASIAYGRPTPVLDGNVIRVLTRWVAIDQPPSRPAVRTALWHLAQQLVPPKAAGDFNQALMELGALICQPRTPRCSSCPVATRCRAYKQKRTDAIPVVLPRPDPVPVVHHVLAIQRRGRYLFHQRPAQGLWSNMWQMPTLENTDDRSAGDSSATAVQWAQERFGLTLQEQDPVGQFQHQTTHRKIRFTLRTYTVTQGRLRARSGQWRSLESLDDLPLANPQRRVVAMLKNF